MSQNFRQALSALQDLMSAGIVEDYAIAGAMAMVFWAEPVPTFDVDVLVALPGEPGGLVSLDGIYRWAEKHGYRNKAEHILIAGVPVQFLPAHGPLADEAIRHAATLDYEGTAVRVVRPEYLVALYLEPGARTPKRRERAAALMESRSTDAATLQDLLSRFGLEP